MGKRSDFKRVERDFYPTPMEAVLPLLPHLKPATLFVEPCAGDGALMDHLEAHGHLCTDAFDIEPQRDGIRQVDALSDWNHAIGNVIITNPPWDRKILHPMIDNFRVKMPTWLLFDADWMHTRQSAPFMPYCRKIVSVGRVKWIPDSKMTGKDNCAWYYFDCTEGETVFIPRA